MAMFNFMETFFFISLGITFILLLLLVYHFKQRISLVEEKNGAMFQIINSIVKEMGSIKRFINNPTHNFTFLYIILYLDRTGVVK